MEFENVEIENTRINSIRISENIEEVYFDTFETNYFITVNATVFIKAAWEYDAFIKRIGIKGTERKIFYVENRYKLGEDMSLSLVREEINYPRHYDDNHFYKEFMINNKEEDSYYGSWEEYGGYPREKDEEEIKLWSLFKEKMFNCIIEEMKNDGFKLEDTTEMKGVYKYEGNRKHYY